MNKAEKKRIIIFAREGFRRFYAEHHIFLEDSDYKPGKKMYRNMSALNKMMYCYLEAEKRGKDYISKEEVKTSRGWDGPSTYAQQERIITNFGLSDTSWTDRDRSVLLLSEKGKTLRNKYREFVKKNPTCDLLSYLELPEFARRYIIDEIENTTSANMTLWKNVILSAIYLYVVLEFMPQNIAEADVTTEMQNAFINCCNYQKDGHLMDVSYFTQPAHMLRNLKILDGEYKMTDIGYRLILELGIFKEVDASLEDFEEIFEAEVSAVEEILDSKVELVKVSAPERKVRKATVAHSAVSTGSKNKNFDESDKKNRKTGDLGERLVYDYEKVRLLEADVHDIDDKLILTSENADYGNAYPCDIISYDPDKDKKIYIEVKTTRYSAETPFYISEEERKFSQENAACYRLYRVFDAIRTKKPKFFETKGYVGDNFTLTSDRYIATREKSEE